MVSPCFGWGDKVGVVWDPSPVALLELVSGSALPLASVASAVHALGSLVMSFQFGEPSAHRNVVLELVFDSQDPTVVFDVPPECPLELACCSLLALFAMVF